MIKVKDVVQIVVKPEVRALYFPTFLHSLIGEVWDINETHVWIKCYVKDINTHQSYVSGPHRYHLTDVEIKDVE